MNYFTKLFKQKFEIGLDEDEKIILEIRRYWIVLLPPILKIFLALFVPGIFIDFIFKNIFLLILFLIWFAIILGYAIYHGVRWYYDSFIITDKRIIDIDQKGVFSRNVSETTFDKIQDITYEVKGFLGTMLNYGDIAVQTASAQEKIAIKKIANPKQIQDQVISIQEQCNENDKAGDVKNENNQGEMTAKELIGFIQKAQSGGEEQKISKKSKVDNIDKKQDER